MSNNDGQNYHEKKTFPEKSDDKNFPKIQKSTFLLKFFKVLLFEIVRLKFLTIKNPFLNCFQVFLPNFQKQFFGVKTPLLLPFNTSSSQIQESYLLKLKRHVFLLLTPTDYLPMFKDTDYFFQICG